MKFIDLSQTVSSNSLIYPGDPPFELEQAASFEKGDDVNSEAVKAGVHSLTHIDAPGHLVKNGKALDRYPLGKFIQEALCIDLKKTASAFDEIGDIKYVKDIRKEMLLPYKEKIGQVGALIIRTGFDEIVKKYDSEEDFRKKAAIKEESLPRMTTECVEWLAGFGNLNLVGIDSLTVGKQEVHAALLSKDILPVEGLYLKEAPERFLLLCQPWKLKGVYGAPCRAIALITNT